MSDVPDYYYKQSSVIPFRVRTGILEILLVTSRSNKRWVVPKGVVEPELTPQESAAKEALEEAGIRGLVFRESIGSFAYPKWGGICTVQVYVMMVEEERTEWLESFRTRRWVSLKDAIGHMKEADMKTILDTLPDFLKKNGVNLGAFK